MSADVYFSCRFLICLAYLRLVIVNNRVGVATLHVVQACILHILRFICSGRLGSQYVCIRALGLRLCDKYCAAWNQLPVFCTSVA